MSKENINFNLKNPLRRLQSVLDKSIIYKQDFITEDDLLFATAEVVAKKKGIKIVRPTLINEKIEAEQFFYQIATASDIRIRKVGLRRNWWKNDSGPLIGFYKESPCALLPRRQGGYRLMDLNLGRSIKVTEKVAALIADHAYNLYPTLPVHINGIKDIFTFALRNLKSDLLMFIVTEAIVGLLALAIPIVTGYVFDIVVPNADKILLLQIILILLMNTVLITLFNLVQSVAIIRLRFKLEGTLQPAIWDRILRFPTRFFHRFSSGDLTFRAGVVGEIQNSLTQTSLVTIVNGFMSVITLILLFYYNATLAWVALGLTFSVAIITFMIDYYQLIFMRKLYYHFGKFVGLVFEILTGILKIRVANAGWRIFGIWADRLAKRSEAEWGMLGCLRSVEAFTAMMMVINPMILFGVVDLLGSSLSFGDFMAFNAAFTLFFNNILQMTMELSEVMKVFPLWERAKPIISQDTLSEVTQTDPGILTGEIAIKNVAFRYYEADKPIFKDFSIEAKPGEFVAIVGPSGTGKTTMFRLLLGFEQPEAGGIFYNGVNLKTLKLSAVRKQIGVAIQNSALIPGTILENIVGNSTQLTRRDAWEVAEKVGLANLIKALPMQMDTLITEGIVTLSGGEAQRLILARALAQNPKIIFLDEATSALDNTTQALVHEHLRNMNATQIIAAHRLSTIINADKIYVVEKGDIIQSGTFESLMQEPGLFADLARRQIK